jgi:hypothetical protein
MIKLVFGAGVVVSPCVGTGGYPVHSCASLLPGHKPDEGREHVWMAASHISVAVPVPGRCSVIILWNDNVWLCTEPLR